MHGTTTSMSRSVVDAASARAKKRTTLVVECSEEGMQVSQRLVSTATASAVRELKRELLQGLVDAIARASRDH